MFTNEITEFTMSLDALDSYSEYIEPLVWENVKKRFEKEAVVMEALKITFHKLGELPEDATKEDIECVKKEVRPFFAGEIDVEYSEDDWKIIFTSGEDGERLDNAATNMEILNRQIELMYKSILINLVSTAECFVGDVLKKYFSQYKGEIVGKLINEQDKIYTIHELEEFESIEEAKEYIIDKKIENLIRGSFEDWVKFLKDKLSLSMGYMSSDNDKMVEIFQRRNLFIHNKGIINRIYISKVKKSNRYSDNIGEQIILDRNYLTEAIFLIHKNLILMAFELWKKREKNDKGRSWFLQKLSEKYMMQEKWNLLESVATFLQKDTVAPDKILKAAQINLWLAEKRLGKLDKKVVEEVDFSAITIDYRICQKALLDDYEMAVNLIEKALDTEQITVEKIYDWPVLSELRETELFKEMVERKNVKVPVINNLIYPQFEDNEIEDVEAEEL